MVIAPPSTFAARAMNSPPLLASRQAAVAIANCLPTRIPLASARKRTSAESALSTASSAKSPGESTSRPGHDLLVEKRRQAAGQPLIDDEADRVRPDIDDRHRRAVVDTALRERPG